MNLIFTILIDGLTYASWLFIVALGLTLVFGVLKILNIAHGSFYALGAYVTATLVSLAASWALPPAMSLVAMLLAAVLVAVLVAPLTERGLLRFFYGRDEVLLVLVTYAMFLMMEDLTKLIWGANPFYVSEPYGMFGNIDIGSQTYVGYDFMLVALAVVVGLGVWWGLNRTRFGAHVFLVGDNPTSARLMGIDAVSVKTRAFTLTGVIAVFCGLMTSVYGYYFWPTTGDGFLLNTIASVFLGGTSVFGGTGSVIGSFVASYIIGAINAGIVSAGINAFYTQLCFGLVIVISVVLQTIIDRKIRRQSITGR